MRNILINVMLLCGLAFGATAQENSTDTEPSVLVCVHKYDDTLKMVFDERNMREYRPKEFNIVLYIILDQNGDEWIMNNYELENYVCVKQEAINK